MFECYILNTQHLAITCGQQNSITLHNTKDGTVTTAKWAPTHAADDPGSYGLITRGPTGTVLAYVRGEDPGVVVFDCDTTCFKQRDKILMGTGMYCSTISYLATGSEGGLVVTSYIDYLPHDSLIIASSLSDKCPIWRLVREEVMGKMILPHAMCTDNMGRLYVVDSDTDNYRRNRSNRIVVLDGSTGCTLQVIHMPELGSILNIECCKEQPHFYMSHKADEADNKISCFMLKEKGQ